MTPAPQNPVRLLPGSPLPRRGATPPTRFLKEGHFAEMPPGWCFVPSGDPALTRRLKAAAPQAWTVLAKAGKRETSVGLCAPRTLFLALQAELARERGTPEYQRKQQSQRRARERQQREYQEEFREAVRGFLSFHPRWKPWEEKLARIVTEFTTPVGSGTVARTQRIPIQERARAAVIAWMRHQTTDYDHTWIPNVAGKRREVRRNLAQESLRLLQAYRQGKEIPANCPLQRAILAQERPPQPTPKTPTTPPPPQEEGGFWL